MMEEKMKVFLGKNSEYLEAERFETGIADIVKISGNLLREITDANFRNMIFEVLGRVYWIKQHLYEWGVVKSSRAEDLGLQIKKLDLSNKYNLEGMMWEEIDGSSVSSHIIVEDKGNKCDIWTYGYTYGNPSSRGYYRITKEEAVKRIEKYNGWKTPKGVRRSLKYKKQNENTQETVLEIETMIEIIEFLLWDEDLIEKGRQRIIFNTLREAKNLLREWQRKWLSMQRANKEGE